MFDFRPPQQITAKLAERFMHNEKYVTFSFEYLEPNKVEFLAGQYVSIQISPEGHRRSYSYSSTPDNTHGFDILVDLAPNGIGVQYLSSLKDGDTVTLLAPMGRFVAEPSSQSTQLMFIATGSGIAPFKSMIMDLLHSQGETRPITLLWGIRHLDTMFWEEEFQELANAYPNFNFHPVVSQPSQEWPLCRGRVTDCIVAHQLAQIDSDYYICGGAAMIDDAEKLLLAQQVPEERIHYEKFF